MTTGRVYIGDSKRHGRGVFANECIRKGEVIGVITGIIEENPNPECEFTCWFDDGHDNWYTVNPDEPFKYLNHDVESNADWTSPVLIATQEIKVGDEITIHYGDEWVEEFYDESVEDFNEWETWD